MVSIKFLFFFALAVACVFAVDTQREKKQVLLGNYGYAGLGYSGAYVPTAYSAGYAAYPSAYSAYPTAYSAGLYGSYLY